ncbi:S8 family serine peptidase [Pseudoduganella sp. DS3]|uniref:S8 family serine peptidase n=1 Tax=Pseudoduganella guangdongensis TaxID=2692179 RepID=A0A6N9HK09_9BURK|nr:S8 family serine peptidase [Pseudoduganella guangdongensis]MYN03567.1 S8 family serine peptidase [Pseudoduganella guangdongensis]
MHLSNAILRSAILATVTASAAVPALAAAPEKIRVIVAFDAKMSDKAKAAIAAAQGEDTRFIFGMNAAAMTIPARALKGLQHSPHFLYVEEDVKRYPLATALASADAAHAGQMIPYGIPMVQADQLPALPQGATGRKVCIIDSGIDAQHEDLSGNSMAGLNDAGTGRWDTDENHHGTHVAGTIAALSNNKGVLGVSSAGKLPLHIVKVFGADGWAYSSTLAAAANQCGAQGASVISMSLGGARASRTEDAAFAKLAQQGVLSIAAAGNDGNRTQSYPAGYASVMSVAALDANKAWATFSQYNKKVEIAAPGVGVLSTVPMGSGARPSLTVGGSPFAAGAMDGSAQASASAPLANFGIGDTINTSVAGKVCLIQRGAIDFGVKVANCEKSGGLGAVIYNNVAGAFSGTLGTTASKIPAVSVSDSDGTVLLGKLGQTAAVAVDPYSYAYYDGTSMATPHVSAVAAMVWSHFPKCTQADVRSALGGSALDLGAKGRDERFGYGLVQALAAYQRLQGVACGKP